MSFITSEGLNIALGKNSRADHVRVKGYSKTISGDEQTLWMGGSLYNWDAWLDGNGDEVAKQLTLRSDTSSEPAKTIRIEGLGPDWEPQTEDIFIDRLTDQTADFVSSTKNFRRVYRAYVKSTEKNTGVTARYDAASTGDIQIYVDWTDWSNPGTLIATNFKGGNNEIFGQSLASVFTVPEGYIGLITGIQGSASESDTCQLQIYTREFGSNAFLCQEIIEMGNGNTASISYEVPTVLPAKTDIDLRAFRNSGSSTLSIAGSFDIILLKQDLASSGSLGF